MASKASKKPARDPFAYFSGGAEPNLSDVSSEEEEEEHDTSPKKKVKNPSFITKQSIDMKETSLPPPGTLFQEVKKPKFLKDKTKPELDWDEIARLKNAESGDVEIKDSHAIPPPTSYEPVTDKLKPTLGTTASEGKDDADTEPGNETNSESTSPTKRPISDENDRDVDVKKLKA